MNTETNNSSEINDVSFFRYRGTVNGVKEKPRSNVTIMCEQKAYELFKEAWKKADFRPHRVYRSGKDGNYHYTLRYEHVQWYLGYAGVEAIADAMDMLDRHGTEDGYAYKLIEIGEDYGIMATSNDKGWLKFEDFYVVADVNLPADNVEINE